MERNSFIGSSSLIKFIDIDEPTFVQSQLAASLVSKLAEQLVSQFRNDGEVSFHTEGGSAYSVSSSGFIAVGYTC